MPASTQRSLSDEAIEWLTEDTVTVSVYVYYVRLQYQFDALWVIRRNIGDFFLKLQFILRGLQQISTCISMLTSTRVDDRHYANIRKEILVVQSAFLQVIVLRQVHIYYLTSLCIFEQN